MTETQVKRWRYFGHDRLYVDTADGLPIGWFDRISGSYVIEQQDFADEFASAIAEHLPTASFVRASDLSEGVAPAGSEIANQTDGKWLDLANNRPGQEARKQAVAWATGADGEEIVGSYLAPLAADGWRILHAITVGTQGADIDHLAIGAGGVYTLNTKTHVGRKVKALEHTIYVDGYKKQFYLPRSREEADRAAKSLEDACGFAVHVSPVIVVLCDAVTVNQPRARVDVIEGSKIATWLRERPPVLRAVEVDTIWEYARRSTTWRG